MDVHNSVKILFILCISLTSIKDAAKPPKTKSTDSAKQTGFLMLVTKPFQGANVKPVDMESIQKETLQWVHFRLQQFIQNLDQHLFFNKKFSKFKILENVSSKRTVFSLQWQDIKSHYFLPLAKEHIPVYTRENYRSLEKVKNAFFKVLKEYRVKLQDLFNRKAKTIEKKFKVRDKPGFNIETDLMVERYTIYRETDSLITDLPKAIMFWTDTETTALRHFVEVFGKLPAAMAQEEDDEWGDDDDGGGGGDDDWGGEEANEEEEAVNNRGHKSESSDSSSSSDSSGGSGSDYDSDDFVIKPEDLISDEEDESGKTPTGNKVPGSTASSYQPSPPSPLPHSAFLPERSPPPRVFNEYPPPPLSSPEHHPPPSSPVSSDNEEPHASPPRRTYPGEYRAPEPPLASTHVQNSGDPPQDPSSEDVDLKTLDKEIDWKQAIAQARIRREHYEKEKAKAQTGNETNPEIVDMQKKIEAAMKIIENNPEDIKELAEIFPDLIMTVKSSKARESISKKPEESTDPVRSDGNNVPANHGPPIPSSPPHHTIAAPPVPIPQPSISEEIPPAPGTPPRTPPPPAPSPAPPSLEEPKPTQAAVEPAPPKSELSRPFGGRLFGGRQAQIEMRGHMTVDQSRVHAKPPDEEEPEKVTKGDEDDGW